MVPADHGFFTCSGFVASATGYIVTAGHCADPVEGRQGLINGFLAAAVKNHSLTEAQAEGLQGKAVQEWKVEGDNNGSAITRTVQVVQAGTASGVQVPQPLTANVVDNRPLDRGDVTLLKVEAPAPMLEVADTVPDVGSDIAAMGFPGSVSTVVDSSLEPSYKTGRVSASQTFIGNPFTPVDAAFSPGMSGGPVVNIQGQVIGIVSYSPRGENQSFNFAAGQDTASGLLTRNGVKSGLSRTDRAFRDGLALFYAKQYREAAAKFDTVLGTEPSHALAQKYRAQAVANFASEATSSTPAPSTPSSVAAAHTAAMVSPAPSTIVPVGNASSSGGATTAAIPIWGWAALPLMLLLAVGRRRNPGSGPSKRPCESRRDPVLSLRRQLCCQRQSKRRPFRDRTSWLCPIAQVRCRVFS